MEIDINDVMSARDRISDVLLPTPIVTNSILNTKLNQTIYIKPEFLQRTGSFKYRGAYNLMSQLDMRKSNGVIAGSSGNHGIAVAEIAQKLGISATLCIPLDAPEKKLKERNRFSPKIVSFNRHLTNREHLMQDLAEKYNLYPIPSSNDVRIIAGREQLDLRCWMN